MLDLLVSFCWFTDIIWFISFFLLWNYFCPFLFNSAEVYPFISQDTAICSRACFWYSFLTFVWPHLTFLFLFCIKFMRLYLLYQMCCKHFKGRVTQLHYLTPKLFVTCLQHNQLFDLCIWDNSKKDKRKEEKKLGSVLYIIIPHIPDIWVPFKFESKISLPIKIVSRYPLYFNIYVYTYLHMI